MQGRLGRWMEWASLAQLSLTGSHPPEGETHTCERQKVNAVDGGGEPVASLGVEDGAPWSDRTGCELPGQATTSHL